MHVARSINKLRAIAVSKLEKPGRYSDGANLYLSISPIGGKRWMFLYMLNGRQREMGLGSAAPGQVTLAEARAKAADARKLLSAGLDPLAVKQERKRTGREIPTFGTFADEYLADHQTKFRNEKHIAQWEMSLKVYCKPIRPLRLDVVDTEAVLKVLKPLWTTVPETASRVRGRIENILDAAKAKGFRTGDNPAAWKGHLKTLLPARQRLTRGHHAALAYDDLKGFMTALRGQQSTAALALELCILTVTRTSEVLNAEWSEFDLDKGMWTIPAHRMKAAHEHKIPLVDRAIEVLSILGKLPSKHHVFPGQAKGKPLSSMAMSMLLRRMGRDNITVHGFRSTFRDWASEQTSFPHETCEHALAHRISDKAEAAYRRGDQFEKRRLLMQAWATFCEPTQSALVLQMRREP
jgi:integrase